ncbi:SseB family protein [Tessaracoccus antarcticus]|uniref:SseB family protein n=1 Tax=Tessaracoccus antarcticus TaxID=2479848 RepID=A0A3M0FYD0_9ACTN|nr:SseB family protein [Tessaracoccus antarcticus]RMB57750.1 SseB family protein [Tessaracoccus antarcticus]
MEPPRHLAQPNKRFLGDDGSPDPLVRAALAAVGDQVSYSRAVVALCASRLLMPIVASGDETDHPDPDRHAEMAAVTLRDGGTTHLLAFTGMDALRAWQSDARPVPCHLDELAASVQPAGATELLLDLAGPSPFVLGGDLLAAIADGQRLVEFEDGAFAWVKQAQDGE